MTAKHEIQTQIKHSIKLVRLGRLQAATEQLMRAESAAREKLKKEN